MVRSDKQIKEREQKLRTAAFVVKQKEECKQKRALLVF